MVNKIEESEFGRGLAVCLVKFAEHFWNPMALDIRNKNSNQKTVLPLDMSRMIETWANGSTDHLYEITVPKRWEGTEIDKKIKKLQDKGLEIGHGFTGKKWKYEDYEELWNLTLEIALLLDQKIGLKRQANLGNC